MEGTRGPWKRDNYLGLATSRRGFYVGSRRDLLADRSQRGKVLGHRAVDLGPRTFGRGAEGLGPLV